MAAEAAAANAPRHAEVDVEDLLDDPELEQLHRDRLLELQREAERRAVMQQKGHGEYTVRRCACVPPATVSHAFTCRAVAGCQRVADHWLAGPRRLIGRTPRSLIPLERPAPAAKIN